MTGRERLLAALANRPVDRPPVWLMRQAGRYLPEYRELRSRYSFWEMVRTPELAVEASLQPIRRYGFDAAILFSDILTVLAAMGIDVRFEEGGPVLSPLVTNRVALDALHEVDPSHAFDFAGEAVGGLVAALHPGTAVIGFAGAPFTLAAYLVEGGPARHVNRLKALAYNDPVLYEAIATRIADVVTGLLLVQIQAGADAVELFDTWAWHLSPDDYGALALPWTVRVIEHVRAASAVPIIVYVRNAAGHLEKAASAGATALSVDGSIRLADANRLLPPGIALQGNLDVALLAGPEARLREAVRAGAEATRGRGWTVNLGQGLTPETPIEGVTALVRAVQELGS
jgi:uroporphyrinogen decarboxylase